MSTCLRQPGEVYGVVYGHCWHYMTKSMSCCRCGEGGDNPVGPCDSCAYGLDPCPRSERCCGHCCNHSWTHEVCCWCGHEYGEDTG